MSQGRTLYDILGVAGDASPGEISSAFASRQAELQGRGDAARDALMALQEAHRILGNPDRRRKYEATLATQAARAAPPRPVSPRGNSRTLLAVAVVAGVVGFAAWKMKPDPSPEPSPTPPRVARSADEPSPRDLKPTPEEEAPGAAAPAASPPPVPPPVVPEGRALSPADLYAVYWPSVVRVTTADANGRFLGQGSGVVTARGTAVTHCHNLKGAHRITVRDGGTDRSAVVSLADAQLDLCNLRVSQFDARVPQVGSLANVRTGQRVYAIGAPWETERALAEGIVSSLHDAGKGVVIQISTPVPPSWDGGALFSTDGQLIGILTARHELGKGINLAVPADWLAKMEPRSESIPSAETPTAIAGMLVGRWHCEDPWNKRSGEYEYGPDGVLQGRKGGVRVPYRVEGMSVRYTARGEPMTLQIESISAGSMVQYFDSGSRLSCKRAR